jgi:hypothetical protein
MIYLVNNGIINESHTIVAAALRRSCSKSALRHIRAEDVAAVIQDHGPAIFVFINADEFIAFSVTEAIGARNSKVILLGNLPASIVQTLGGRQLDWPQDLNDAAKAPPAPSGSFSESEAKVNYIDRGFKTPIESRPFSRFDYASEWNNLAYGFVRTDFSSWSVQQNYTFPASSVLAEVTIGLKVIGSYAALWLSSDFPAAVLWFNRPVGPVDSPEWVIIEEFLSNKFNRYFAQPVLLETPYGYSSLVTMRLDCDEDIESARFLFEQYKALDVPLSLAITTKNLGDPRNHFLPREVVAAGGAILAHSVSHAPMWGGSYDAAMTEAKDAQQRLQEVLNIGVDFAVAPFHHAPSYARAALFNSGYKGCIGGIVCNDPDFLVARGGVAPYDPEGFVTHSQQCMLHGECMLPSEDYLKIYKAAYDQHCKAGLAFGYLDHPFSERYQYGWRSEESRASCHRDLISFLKKYGATFANENDVMNFVRDISQINVLQHSSHLVIEGPEPLGKFAIAYQYDGDIYPARIGSEIKMESLG